MPTFSKRTTEASGHALVRLTTFTTP
jgi:hypothetical protein